MIKAEFDSRCQALRARYPYQFCKLAEWQYSIKPGWLPIFERLCDDIDAALNESEKPLFYWRQVKEKFGGLRCYWSHGPISIDIIGDGNVMSMQAPRNEDPADPEPRLVAKAQPLIRTAALEAAKTCSVCGSPGSLRKDRAWILTLCDQHAAQNGRPAPFDDEPAPSSI